MTRVFAASTALFVAVGGASAFVPSSSKASARTTATFLREVEPEHAVDTTSNNKTDDMPIYFNVRSTEDPGTTAASLETAEPELSPAALAATAAIANSYGVGGKGAINGWRPKEDFALWGLPGAIAPLGFFDPIGFAREGTTLNDAKRLREAEVQHGRVAMLATVGYLAQEWANTAIGGGPFGMSGPANDQLQQTPTIPFVLLTACIAAAELHRAKVGWVEPKPKIGSKTLWTLRDSYYPGDIGFDPLGLKPEENYAFQRMQTKELSNGRLAMIGWAGMCAQELVNHKTIAETWDFYSKVFSGEYYYY